MENLEKLKTIVEQVLKDDERARNSDHWLILEVLRRMGFKIFIDYKDLKDMPSFESITRCRRKIFEENPNINADPKIEEYRDERREQLRRFFKSESSILW